MPSLPILEIRRWVYLSHLRLCCNCNPRPPTHWCHAQSWCYNDPLSSVPMHIRTTMLSIGHCYITVLLVVYFLLYSCLLSDRSPNTCDSWSYYDHFWYIMIKTMIIIVHCHITALFAIFLFLCSYSPEALTDPLLPVIVKATVSYDHYTSFFPATKCLWIQRWSKWLRLTQLSSLLNAQCEPTSISPDLSYR